MPYKIIYRDKTVVGTYYYQETDQISSIINWYKLLYLQDQIASFRVGICSPFYEDCTAQNLIFLPDQTPLTLLAQQKLYLVVDYKPTARMCTSLFM